MKKLLVTFPKLSDQKALVQKFDSLEADIQNLESVYQRKLDDLAELKQSILRKAFSSELTAQPDQALREAVA